MDNVEIQFEYSILNSLEDIDAIIDLHCRFFKDVLIGQIGHKFLSYYYLRLFDSSEGFICVCRYQGKIVGFLSGLACEKEFYSFNYYWKCFQGVFINIFRNPLLFLNVLRYIKRVIIFKHEEFHSELVSIAVLQDQQKKGIGKKLIDMFEVFLKSKGCLQYKIFTDTKFSTGSKFYEAMNIQLNQEANLFGMGMRLYIKEIN